MKIDELIKKLEEIRDQQGNIEVLYDAGDGDEDPIGFCLLDDKLLIQGRPTYWF